MAPGPGRRARCRAAPADPPAAGAWPNRHPHVGVLPGGLSMCCMRTLTENLVVRVEPGVADRVRDLAAFCGLTPAAWVRAAIAHTDSCIVLDQLRAIEQAGGQLTDRHRAI